ncbi:hypothetical protein AWC38_SpisGene16378 [Stylophora pistillata]|uniref:Uncharacterized protein n=1 Tax=Stylophora pistillata TaxID=50429 RepID=A0A2B4RQY8_STYPI|nr:hypothetical protein AWC38_SpisGene16378 [Stylophora pistillata]
MFMRQFLKYPEDMNSQVFAELPTSTVVSDTSLVEETFLVELHLGCRNVSHYHRQQSFSGLHSPGRSDFTFTWTSGAVGRENQRNGRHGGTVEQWVQRTRETVGTEDRRNSRNRTREAVEIEKQWKLTISGTVGTGNQRNSGYTGPAEQWVQRTSGTMRTEDQKNSGTEDQSNIRFRGPVEQWVQRTSGSVGTNDQRNNGH